ncbi:MAG TPA: alpha-amylase family glycosyl hydrolase [Solirubrobacteraceae bacterium]|nr:alpha-amylase family glycosyl hydrolase [Solirubrobacteraceae bacterium]
MQHHWWQQGVVYQIYPRSFADANGDGIGDLRGIIERFDHLAGADGALGVNAIWLSPFYPSPMADFGYDVADYIDVDPLFGTLADFDELLALAHARGVKVLIDWVPNHSSDRHAWFRESRSARSSPKRDWYVWRDPAPDGGPPNNWRSSFRAVGPAWTLDPHTGQYYRHTFMAQQPDLNWDNPAVEAAMHDVLRFWLDRGVDGFRLDAINTFAKDPEMRDNEPGRRHDQDWPTIHDRLRRVRAVIDEYEDRVLVGEVYLRDLRRVVAYVNSGDQLHLAHNFVFVHLPWDAAAFRASVGEFEKLAEPAVWAAWFLENHDHSRVASRYAAAPGSGERRARAALMLVCSLRGTPFIYQGEELGLPDAEVAPDRVVDVDGRDPERAPIPWRRPSVCGPGAGFTTGEPWLALVADAERLCVEAQREAPASTLSFTRALLATRARLDALRIGSQRPVAADPDALCFLRAGGDGRLLVAINYTSTRLALGLREPLGDHGTVELSTDPERTERELTLDSIVLSPDEGLIIRLP